MTDQDMPSHHGKKVSHRVMEEYPNDTLRLLLERASCRSFSDRPVPQDVMGVILEAGARAPTAGNLQPLSIIRIEDSANRALIAEMCGQKFIGDAPVSLLFCLDFLRLRRWAVREVIPFTADRSFRHFWVSFQDVIICAQNICTAADAMGLGSCYVGTVMEFIPALRDLCRLPQGVLPVVLVCMGYPLIRPLPRKKLSVSTLVHSEVYQDPGDEEILKIFHDKYPDRISITPERLETIAQVCREVEGEEFAARCLENIQEKGFISPAQRYFGLHYMANRMAAGNTRRMQEIKDAGFRWFEDFLPGGKERD
jgi:nitroreductase